LISNRRGKSEGDGRWGGKKGGEAGGGGSAAVSGGPERRGEPRMRKRGFNCGED